MAGVYDIEIEQGSDTNDIEIYPTEDDGSPIDLSGYTARLQIRPDVRSETLYDDLTTENSRIVIESFVENFEETPTTFYKIIIKFPNETTSAYHWVTGVYDLELYSGTLVDRFLKGTVTTDREVTR